MGENEPLTTQHRADPRVVAGDPQELQQIHISIPLEIIQHFRNTRSDV